MSELAEHAYLLAKEWDGRAVALFDRLGTVDPAEAIRIVEIGSTYSSCARELRQVIEIWSY